MTWQRFFSFSALLQLFIVLPHIDFCLRLVIGRTVKRSRSADVTRWWWHRWTGWWGSSRNQEADLNAFDVIMKFSLFAEHQRREIHHKQLTIREFVELWTWISRLLFWNDKRASGVGRNCFHLFKAPWTLNVLEAFLALRFWMMRRLRRELCGRNEPPGSDQKEVSSDWRHKTLKGVRWVPYGLVAT